MNDGLEVFGSIPFTTAAVSSLYPTLSDVNQKVSSLERSGKLIRLKRGLYIVNPEWSRCRVCTELVANHLYSPSYVSMHTALRWYGLIPERVVLSQSMTLKHTREFENGLGRFTYIGVGKEYFPIGIRQEQSDGVSFIIASPEKALCDLINATAGLNLRYKKEAEQFLEEDLRFDMDAFSQFDPNIFSQCAKTGNKKASLETIIKLL